MQVDMPFFKHIDDGEKSLISNPVIAFSGCHFFGYECNWLKDIFPVLQMLLGEDAGCRR